MKMLGGLDRTSGKWHKRIRSNQQRNTQMLFVVHADPAKTLSRDITVVGAFLMKSDAENFLLTLQKDTYVLSEVDGVWKHWRLIGEAI